MQRVSGTEEAMEPRIKVIINWEQELEGKKQKKYMQSASSSTPGLEKQVIRP